MVKKLIIILNTSIFLSNFSEGVPASVIGNAKMQQSFFLQNHKETEIEIFAFCTITFEPIESFFCTRQMSYTDCVLL